MCCIALSQGNLCPGPQRGQPLLDSFENICCVVRHCECVDTSSNNRYSFCKLLESISYKLFRVLFSDAWLFLIPIKDNRSWWTIMADGEIGIRFRYFAMILFQNIMYSVNEWTYFNLRTRPVGSGTQSTIASLSLSTTGCPIILCMGLHLAD